MTRRILTLFTLVLLLFVMSGVEAVTYTTRDYTFCVFNPNFNDLTGWESYCTPGQTSACITTVNGVTGVYLKAESNATTSAVIQICPSNLTTYNSGGSMITNYYYSGTTVLFQPITFINDADNSIGPYQYVTDGLMIKIRLRGLTQNTYGLYSSGLIPGTFSVLMENSLSHNPGVNATPPTLYNVGQLMDYTQSGVSMPDWNILTFTLLPENPCDWWQIRNLRLSYTPAGVDYVSGVMVDKIELYGISVDAE